MRCGSPISPAHMDWTTYYPAFATVAQHKAETANLSQPDAPKLIKGITIADIGCGFGGLLVALAPLIPEELMLGTAC